MYKFLLTQWKLGKVDEAYLQEKVEQNKITQEQYEEIISTERVI